MPELGVLISLIYLGALFQAWRRGRITIAGSPPPIERNDHPVQFLVVMVSFALWGLLLFAFAAWFSVKDLLQWIDSIHFGSTA